MKTKQFNEDELENVFDELKDVLGNMLGSLKANPLQPTEENSDEAIYFDYTERDDTRWKAILTEELQRAKTFEIHCWNEETAEIDLALQYGTIKPFDWQHGTVIEGNVTPAFVDMLLNRPKPTDTELYNKMTSFFTIFLDNGFSSGHYGTEVVRRKSAE